MNDTSKTDGSEPRPKDLVAVIRAAYAEAAKIDQEAQELWAEISAMSDEEVEAELRVHGLEPPSKAFLQRIHNRVAREKGYDLVQVSSPEDWEALHNLRRTELFARRDDVIYDENHPDDHASHHFPLVLKFQGRRIGTVRLDLFERGEAAIRLVAIAKEEQRKGHGRVMEQLFEELARNKGVSKLFVNANPAAIGYYERLDFIYEDWQEPSGERVLKDLIPMSKQI